MKVPERSGMWVEMSRSEDRENEITLRVPNGIWVGWMLDVHLQEDDLADFLRSINWQVELPHRVTLPLAH